MVEVTPGPGHNSGAQPHEIVSDEITVMLASFQRRTDELIASETRAKVENNDDVGRAGDLSAMMRVLIERIGSRRDEIEEPYSLAVNVARRRTGEAIDKIIAARERLTDKVDKFRNDQREKIRLAQQQQRDAEAKLREAAEAKTPGLIATPPEPESSPITLPKVIGDMGSTTSDRKVKIFTIADAKKVDTKVLNHPKVIEAIRSVCRDLAKVQPTIKGVVITEDFASTVRK